MSETRVWRSPDGERVRVQFADGDVWEITSTDPGTFPDLVDDAPPEWPELVPAPIWQHADGSDCDAMERQVVYSSRTSRPNWYWCTEHLKSARRVP